MRRTHLTMTWCGVVLAGAVLAGTLLLLPSCQGSGGGTADFAPRDLPPTTTIGDEPTLRVRIAANTQQVTASANSAIALAGPTGEARSFQPPIRISRSNGAFDLQTGDGNFRWQVPRLHLRAPSTDMITIDGTRYPGSVWIVPLQYDGRETNRVDVVNHVALETYLPGVLERELWPHWDPKAFEAQAIAARSYALFERHLHRDQHYDLTSTTASQVYGGESTNAKVLAAVRDTRGRVLTYDGHVVPAFYSSCCGGTSQSATNAFPHLGWPTDLSPLRSKKRNDWCRPSKHHRWGPIARRAASLSQRMRAWGEAQHHDIENMTTIQRIDITQRTGAGRPSVFTITDTSGKQFTLGPEQFRVACNRPVSGLPELEFEQRVRSSHVQPRVHGSTVQFTDGRGWGHGVGMCQWGAQGMAERGHGPIAILREFYPGAQVRQMY